MLSVFGKEIQDKGLKCTLINIYKTVYYMNDTDFLQKKIGLKKIYIYLCKQMIVFYADYISKNQNTTLIKCYMSINNVF